MQTSLIEMLGLNVYYINGNRCMYKNESPVSVFVKSCFFNQDIMACRMVLKLRLSIFP